MYQEIQLPLSPASLSFSLASLTNQFHMKAVQARLKTESVFQSPFTLHWVPAQIRCQCLSGFIQKSLYDSDSRAPSESECHNSRKLPPLSHRPDMRSYKQAKETGSLATVWRSLTPTVHVRSESETTFAPRHFKSELKCLTGSVPSSHQFGGGVLQSSEGSQIWSSSHCQSGWGWSCYDIRSVHTAPQSSRASSAVWGSPAGIEPQHATLLSNNSLNPQCRSGLR